MTTPEEPLPPKWSLAGERVTGKLVRVYDGDTFTLILPVCCKQFQFSCRLSGIDTPELRTKNPIEKVAGYRARDWVRDLLDKRPFEVVCHGGDKYGRVLCDIVFPPTSENDEEESLADLLINNGMAYRYEGATKQRFEDWYVQPDSTLDSTPPTM